MTDNGGPTTPEIESFLRAMAAEVHPPAVAPPTVLARARRRVMRTATAGLLAVALLVYGGVVGVSALTQRSPAHPAEVSECRWSTVSGPPGYQPGRFQNSLLAVAVVSDHEVWALGFYYTGQEGGPTGTFVARWDGRGWRTVSLPRGVQAQDLAAIPGGELWAVGYADPSIGGTALRWDGSGWQEIKLADPGTKFWNLQAISGTSSRDIWAVGGTATGHSSHPLAEHWDGSRWSIVATPTTRPRPLIGNPYPGLDAVEARSPTDVWAVGAAENVAPAGPSNTFIEHWDGVQWSLVPSPDVSGPHGRPFDHLFGVSASSGGDAWVVGSHGNGPGFGGGGDRPLIEHWDGSSWRVATDPGPAGTAALNAVAAISPRQAWAVGSTGVVNSSRALVERWDGQSWSVIPGVAGPGSRLYDVAVSQSGTVWTVGSTVDSGREQPLVMRCA